MCVYNILLVSKKQLFVIMADAGVVLNDQLVLKFALRHSAAAVAANTAEWRAMSTLASVWPPTAALPPFLPVRVLHTPALQALVLPRVPPLAPGVATLLDAVADAHVSDLVVRAALFQALAALAALRVIAPDFRHNDLKADNVLVAPPEGGGGVEGRAARAAGHVRVVLIDFELAHAPSLGLVCAAAVARSRKAADYGLCEANTSWHDVHLLLYDCLRVAEEGVERGEGRLVPRRAWLAALVSRTLRPAWLRVGRDLTPAARLSCAAQRAAPPCGLAALLNDAAFAAL